MLNKTPITFFMILILAFAAVGTMSFFVGNNFQTGSSVQGAIVGDASKGTILEIKVISTNDTYTRYLGVSINKPLEPNWWNGNVYTCNFVVRPSYVGNTFVCELNQPYNYSQTSISADVGYNWNIQVTYKQTDQVNNCDNINKNNRCPTNIFVTTSTATTSTGPTIKYKVCTGANPNNVGGGFYLNGQSHENGQIPQIETGALYTLSPISVPGYQFISWTTSRGVSVSDENSQNTTVVFSASGWDGNCVGSLAANYVLQTSTSSTTTTTIPPFSFTCAKCNTGSCTCTTPCNSGVISFYDNSTCSGVPYRQLSFLGGNFSFSIGTTTYLQISCDGGKMSVCKTVYPNLSQQ